MHAVHALNSQPNLGASVDTDFTLYGESESLVSEGEDADVRRRCESTELSPHARAALCSQMLSAPARVR